MSSVNPSKSAPVRIQRKPRQLNLSTLISQGFVESSGLPAVTAPSILQQASSLLSPGSIQNAINNNAVDSGSTTPTSSEEANHNNNVTVGSNFPGIEPLKALENLELSISNGNYDPYLIKEVYKYLKSNGSVLDDGPFRDQLDQYFNTLRNVSRDERIDSVSRAMLLELVELRAMSWIPTEELNAFYQKKCLDMDSNSSLTSSHISGSLELATSSSISAFCANNVSVVSLTPSEVIKPSGKFSKPAKVPGKNYVKDEFVIRNCDSGKGKLENLCENMRFHCTVPFKVMGIKGRRVHLIEELSDTVISFQRVNAGAKERLLQITGPNEDSISRAKYLIEDTIKRNASPVPFEQPGFQAHQVAGFGSSGQPLSTVASGSNLSRSASNADGVFGSGSGNPANLPHVAAVTVGADVLVISSSNSRLSEEAKLVLEQYFGANQSQRNGTNPPDNGRLAGYEASESSDSEVYLNNAKDGAGESGHSQVQTSNSTSGAKAGFSQPSSFGYHLSRQTSFHSTQASTVNKYNEDLKKSLQRSASQGSFLPGRTSLRYMNVDFKVEPDDDEYSVEKRETITYDREFLLQYADSPVTESQSLALSEILTKFPEIARNSNGSGSGSGSNNDSAQVEKVSITK